MDPQLSRREFAARSTLFFAGVSLAGAGGALAETESLRRQRLVELGVNALARAPELNYFADGHRGASLISAHMMCVDNQFDDVATARIVELFDANWAPTKLCEPFPEGDAVPDAIAQIGSTLAAGGDTLRQVGHDAIFAMHAIKAFRLLPESATRERMDGVRRLIESMKPWRDGEPDAKVVPPPFIESQAAARFVLREASDAIDRWAGYGQGFSGHLLTFGQSLVELAALGYEDVAESCRPAFRKYVTLTRRGPQPDDKPRAEHARRGLRPNDTEYWQRRGARTLGLGHVFKYPYAYYDLVARAADPQLEVELDAKAWRLF